MIDFPGSGATTPDRDVRPAIPLNHQETYEQKESDRQDLSGKSKSHRRRTGTGRLGCTGDVLDVKMAGTETVAASMPYNPTKPNEYGELATRGPEEGAHVDLPDPIVGASTVTESNGSDKVGSGVPTPGHNPTVAPLDRVRVDSTGRILTTNQGVPVARQPELAEGRACAGRRCSRTSSSARRSPTSITSASPSASCTPAARRRMASSSATSR